MCLVTTAYPRLILVIHTCVLALQSPIEYASNPDSLARLSVVMNLDRCACTKSMRLRAPTYCGKLSGAQIGPLVILEITHLSRFES